MKPKLKCETHKPQGRHKGPGGKRRKRKDSPPSHVDSKDNKDDSVAKAKRERKKRQDGSGYFQSSFP